VKGKAPITAENAENAENRLCVLINHKTAIPILSAFSAASAVIGEPSDLTT
jgi:phosphohistidine swiveling domain-containing protein